MTEACRCGKFGQHMMTEQCTTWGGSAHRVDGYCAECQMTVGQMHDRLADIKHRTETEGALMKADLYRIAEALGIGARAYSGHEAIEKDFLPKIAELMAAREALAKIQSREADSLAEGYDLPTHYYKERLKDVFAIAALAADNPTLPSPGRRPQMLTDERLAEMLEIARRDDWHLKLVGSDIRMLIGDLTAAREIMPIVERICCDTWGEDEPTMKVPVRWLVELDKARAAIAGKGE